MGRAKTIVPLLLFLAIGSSCRKELDVRISSPKDNAAVPEQPVVQGTVSDARATVWVVVHPLETEVNTEYWVQPEAEVKGDGTWTAEVYVGDPGKEDVGKQFVLMAVANPKKTLTDDDVLTTWPASAAQSDVVSVTRK
ncbi:MAG TPA: hypothetical protein VGL70_10435 [Candidatus Binatia bacterium]